MSDTINTDAVGNPEALAAAVSHLLTIDFDENNSINIVVKQGVSTWQALGALEVASHILRTSYTAR